jgi:hypothetical protein
MSVVLTRTVNVTHETTDEDGNRYTSIRVEALADYTRRVVISISDGKLGGSITTLSFYEAEALAKMLVDAVTRY